MITQAWLDGWLYAEAQREGAQQTNNPIFDMPQADADDFIEGYVSFWTSRDWR